MAGKGGAGKTSITGTLARLFAQDGYRVLAIDNDLNPNLFLALGLPAERMRDLPTFPAEIVRQVNGGYELTMSLEEICADCSLAAPDGVTLLVAAQPKQAGTG